MSATPHAVVEQGSAYAKVVANDSANVVSTSNVVSESRVDIVMELCERYPNKADQIKRMPLEQLKALKARLKVKNLVRRVRTGNSLQKSLGGYCDKLGVPNFEQNLKDVSKIVNTPIVRYMADGTPVRRGYKSEFKSARWVK